MPSEIPHSSFARCPGDGSRVPQPSRRHMRLHTPERAGRRAQGRAVILLCLAVTVALQYIQFLVLSRRSAAGDSSRCAPIEAERARRGSLLRSFLPKFVLSSCLAGAQRRGRAPAGPPARSRRLRAEPRRAGRGPAREGASRELRGRDRSAAPARLRALRPAAPARAQQAREQLSDALAAKAEMAQRYAAVEARRQTQA